MDERFWQDRWAREHVPFHQSEINERLRRFFPEHVPRPRRVLVPLSGKTRDLIWLRDHTNARVVGNELVERAVRAFHEENRIPHERRDVPPFVVYVAGRLETWVGDFFALPEAIAEPFDAVYDRASLVAIPPERRVPYARCIERLTGPGARYLLLALEYDPSEMDGPPFSLPAGEIDGLFGASFRVESLERIEKHEHSFARHGVGPLVETAYLLRRT